MQVNVFNYVSPLEVDNVFKKLMGFEIELVGFMEAEDKAKLDISLADAKMVADDPDFKWGRNDTERTAQSRNNATAAYEALAQAQANVKLIESRRKQVRIDVERIKLLRDLFNTSDYDIDAKDVSPS